MLTLNEFQKVAEWLKRTHTGLYYISFIEGFKGTYVIIETEKDSPIGRKVYTVREILDEYTPEN